jgi:lysosomal acid lipase/cholesteryl ester hydrolase
MSFVVNDEDKAPAFYFANRGYDVWLGNFRGNRYTINHVSLDVESAKFWDFSFDEMVNFDLKDMVSYVH